MFPVGTFPEAGNMAEMMASAVGASFMIGVQIAVPFIIVGMLIYIGMGILSRLMPQVQVFILAVPVQILLSLLTLSIVLSAGMLFWVGRLEEGMMYLMQAGGKDSP
jgi:flagellar biosynthetic protein FliR